eukprot:jgi/Mesvir1/23211/Mv22672-RA.1
MGEKDENKEERKRRKKEEKEKRKKKKKRRDRHSSSSESVDSDEERRRLVKKAKKFLKKHGSEAGPAEMPAPSGSSAAKKKYDISDADYFSKNMEFSTWLKESRNTYFSSLSSTEARELFSDFVKVWNDGKLSGKYYDGMDKAVRTGHNWAIKRDEPPSSAALAAAEEERRESAKATLRLEQKKARQEHNVVLDELLPKATGREALQEKRAIRRQEAKAREDSPELMSQGDVMGGGDSFQDRLARQKAFQQKKEQAKAAELAERRERYTASENAKVEAFKAMMGVQEGVKYSIPKRQP